MAKVKRERRKTAAVVAPDGPIVVGRQTILHGDASHLPLDILGRGRYHLSVWSPPYWGGLRDYGLEPSLWPGVEFAPMSGEPLIVVPPMACVLGEEPDPRAYVAHMVHIGRQLKELLRKDASLWINIGDCYASGGRKDYVGNTGIRRDGSSEIHGQRQPTPPGLKAKDLCAIPERVRLALQADGWYLRAVPPWLKTNPMPSAADDRPGYTHEDIIFLTLDKDYYFDMDAVRVPVARSTVERDRYSRITGREGEQYAVPHDHETTSHPGGRNVWTIDYAALALDEAIAAAEDWCAALVEFRDSGGMLVAPDGSPLALKVVSMKTTTDHYATYPPSLIRSIVAAATSEKGCCPACGSPWRRVHEFVETGRRKPERGAYADAAGSLALVKGAENHRGKNGLRDGIREGYWRTLGWEPSCGCLVDPPPMTGDTGMVPAPVPCRVLDIFNGTATTLVVCDELGRDGTGVEAAAEWVVKGAERLARPHKPRPKRRSKSKDDGPEERDLFTAENVDAEA